MLHSAISWLLGAPKLNKDLALNASSVFTLHRSVTTTKTSRVPNQSLNLTEPAVDEFAARHFAETKLNIATSAQRTT
jgi:hypothetical protein